MSWADRLFKGIENRRGDTIIEVIMCVAVLGTAMAGAYVSTTHSLRLGTDAGNRNRAVGFLQQQLEMVKAAEQANPASLSDYIVNPNHPFCIDSSSGGKIPASSSGTCGLCVNSAQSVIGYADNSGSCPSGSDQAAEISVIYDDSSRVFTANISWDAPNGSGKDQSVAYYKLAESAAAAVPMNSITGDIEVMSNPNLPVQPRLIIYYNGISLPSNKVYDVTYPVGPQKCNSPGPGQYTTPAPPSQFTAINDILEERCESFPLNIDLSSIGVPVTSIKFDFLNDSNAYEPGHSGEANYLEDNNVILRNVSIPGKTVTLASACFIGGAIPVVPIGSQVPPYSLWLAWNHCPATFIIN